MIQNNPVATTKMDDEEPNLMDALNQVMGAYNPLNTIIAIFTGSSAPSLQDIIGMVVKEIRDVFKQELANEDLRSAAATLQNVQDFINKDYANAVAANESTQQLYTLLTQDNAAPSLSNFDTIINKITSWASDFAANPGIPQLNIACQALSFSLTSYYYEAMVYKERARVYWTASSGPNDRTDGVKAEWANMQDTAANANTTLSPILTTFAASRKNQLLYQSEDFHYILTDLYLPDSSGLPLVAETMTDPAAQAAVQGSVITISWHRAAIRI